MRRQDIKRGEERSEEEKKDEMRRGEKERKVGGKEKEK